MLKNAAKMFFPLIKEHFFRFLTILIWRSLDVINIKNIERISGRGGKILFLGPFH